MTRCSCGLILLGLIAIPLPALTAAPPLPWVAGGGESLWPAAAPQGEYTSFGDSAASGGKKNGEEKNGNDKDKDNGKKDKEPPKNIRDNAFFVEEAVNQEPGVVQHIFNWVHLWDNTSQGHTRDFIFLYTMELPLGSQAHQFSFTTQFLNAFEKLDGGPATQQGGVGDTFLNYRYQLLHNDDFLWCAPRFTLILPTGDERFGTGNGQLGYQFNLPVSRYGENFDFHFNAGATYVPNVTLPLAGGVPSPRQDLRAFNLGVSSFWKPQTNLHLFVEAVALWNEEIGGLGNRDHSTQVFVNPGVRYAVCQLDDVEWVIGLSVPVGLTRDAPDIGVFAYMSVEHAFKKKNGDNGKE